MIKSSRLLVNNFYLFVKTKFNHHDKGVFW